MADPAPVALLRVDPVQHDMVLDQGTQFARPRVATPHRETSVSGGGGVASSGLVPGDPASSPPSVLSQSPSKTLLGNRRLLRDAGSGLRSLGLIVSGTLPLYRCFWLTPLAPSSPLVLPRR